MKLATSGMYFISFVTFCSPDNFKAQDQFLQVVSFYNYTNIIEILLLLLLLSSNNTSPTDLHRGLKRQSKYFHFPKTKQLQNKINTIRWTGVANLGNYISRYFWYSPQLFSFEKHCFCFNRCLCIHSV